MDAKIPELPFEVYDLILKALQDINLKDALRIRALKNCSLVSHTFRKISQRYLFRSLVISPQGCKSGGTKALEEILSRDNIGKRWVKTLVIVTPLKPEDQQELARLFRLFKNVSCLKLSSDGDDWSENLQPFKQAVERIMFARGLRELSIVEGDYPLVRWISSLQNVTTLELVDVFCTSSDDGQTPATGRTRGLRLKSLWLEATNDHMANALGVVPGTSGDWVDWSRLRNVTFSNHVGDEGRTYKAILARSSNLRTINMINGVDGGAPDVELSDLLEHLHEHALRTLVEIAMEYEELCYESDDPYRGLFQALERFPANNTLRRIKLDMCLVFLHFAVDPRDISEWRSFESVLTPSRFPALRKVAIDVTADLGDTDSSSEEDYSDEERARPVGKLKFCNNVRDIMKQLRKLTLQGSASGWGRLKVICRQGENWPE